MKTDKTKVLIVEKSESDALAISNSLIQEGNGKYQVDTVASLPHAVISINQQDFDVVLTSLEMPGVVGFDIVPALLNHDENLPIVVLSDQDNEKVAIDVMHSGAQDYLIKSRADGYLIRRALDYAIERKRIEQGISYLAQYDSLTGLANRALFRERLNRAMVRADRNKKIVALMFIDLDRFKNINDSMGHDVGDQLLVEIGKRLKDCTREDDTIARQGGDEFTIILEDIAHIGDVSVVANKILSAMVQPVEVNGYELFVTPSIGITLYPIDDIHSKDLLRNADAAMYKAKDSGRNCFRFYTVDMNKHVEEKILMETKLRHAIENQEFELHYQPKFNLNSRELIGAEALIRWNHPEQGYISPGLFIPLAEETGLIHSITEWVVNEACQQNSRWQLQGYDPIRMSLNLSPKEFTQPNLARKIFNLIICADLAPKYIELEITESALMEDVNKSQDILNELKRWGIRISIDDFGTGYSSLSYLKKFPIDTLKIDQSFVRDVLTDADDSAIVSAIIAMARSLRLNVIAEGVETEQQLQYLAAKGCSEAQGYYLGKPVSADEFTRFFLNSGNTMAISA